MYVCAHICVCMLICAHGKTRGQCWVSPSISFRLILWARVFPWTWSFVLRLDWLSRMPPRSSWCHLHCPRISGRCCLTQPFKWWLDKPRSWCSRRRHCPKSQLPGQTLLLMEAVKLYVCDLVGCTKGLESEKQIRIVPNSRDMLAVIVW